MHKKLRIVFISIAVLLMIPICASAHPGRTDANGGHYNRKTGKYHYHNNGKKQSSGSSSDSYAAKPKETQKPIATPKPSSTHTEKQEKKAESAAQSKGNGDNTENSLIERSLESIKPYIDVLGIDSVNGDMTATDDFIAGMSRVELMGKLGSVSHGFANAFIIVQMEWVSKEEATYEEFLEFIEKLNLLFGESCLLESFDDISDECYTWLDSNTKCKVLAWYEDSHIHVRWFLSPDLFVD